MKFLNILVSLAAAAKEYNSDFRVVDMAVGSKIRNNDPCSKFHDDCHSCVLAGCSPALMSGGSMVCANPGSSDAGSEDRDE